MSTPIVNELPPHLEPVTRDPFIDDLAGGGPSGPAPVSPASPR
jgi:hypothetical protein